MSNRKKGVTRALAMGQQVLFIPLTVIVLLYSLVKALLEVLIMNILLGREPSGLDESTKRALRKQQGVDEIEWITAQRYFGWVNQQLEFAIYGTGHWRPLGMWGDK